MAKNEFNFTDNRLRKLQPIPGKKRSYYYDTKTDGLRIQVTAAGTLSFQFQTWDAVRKRPATKTLGKYPALPINKARKKATREMNDVNEGRDIEGEAQAIRSEDTFSVMFTKWLKQFAKPHKKSWIEDERRYNLYMKKPFGGKKISWITTQHIRQWHGNITRMKKQKGRGAISPSTANRALALISTVFNQMRPKHPNPCKGVKKFEEVSRDRFLQPYELKKFFETLFHPDTPEQFREYILLSIFTGGRRGNVLAMKWNEVSFDRQVWTVPAGKSKNASAMDIPLVPEAMTVLEKRQKLTSSIFVFPGKGKTGHYCEPRKAWESLLRRASLTDVRLHDLRRTLGSYQTMTGASTAIVGKTLGHKSSAATAVYARLNLDPVRDSMEKAVGAMLAARELPEKVVNLGGNK